MPETPNALETKLSCTTPVIGRGDGDDNCTTGVASCIRLIVEVNPVIAIVGTGGGVIEPLHGNCAGAEFALSVSPIVKEKGPDEPGFAELITVVVEPVVLLNWSQGAPERLQV